MTKEKQIIKSTIGLILTLTVGFGTAASAGINKGSAPPPKPAAKPAAPAARNNTPARPAQNAAARPNSTHPEQAAKPAAIHPSTGRPEAARKDATRPEPARNTAHANPAHANPAHPNTAHTNPTHDARPDAHHEAANHHENRPADHRERPGAERGRPDARNAAYHGRENLHGGRRIPEDRFRGSFGRAHQFRVGHPVMIGGQASFRFGGFWFGIVDPWPAAWLYTDAVYVDLIEGSYVLVDVAHPEVTVALAAGDPAPATCAADAEPVAVVAAPVVEAPVVGAPVVAAPVVVRPVVAVTVFPWWHWRRWR